MKLQELFHYNIIFRREFIIRLSVEVWGAWKRWNWRDH